MTKFREKLRQESFALAVKSEESTEDMIKYVDRLAKKVGRGYFSKPKDKSRLNDEVNDLSIYDKHLTAKQRKLSA